MEAELLDYLQHIRPRAASETYKRKHYQISVFSRWLTDERKHYAEVKQSDVERYLLSFSSQAYRQSMCAVVREFYDVLRLRHASTRLGNHPYACSLENPAARIEFKHSTGRKLPNVPSQAAVNDIFARLYERDDDLRIRDALMAELAYGSGLRRGELARLNVEDIDFANYTLHVIGKGNKRRIVPLTSKAVEGAREYLGRRRATGGPLFVSWNGRRMGTTSVYYVLRSRVGIRPHLLRHACATHLLKNGCGVRAIQELLGHDRLDTTYIYTAVEKENLREVIGRSHPRNGACFSDKKS